MSKPSLTYGTWRADRIGPTIIAAPQRGQAQTATVSVVGRVVGGVGVDDVTGAGLASSVRASRSGVSVEALAREALERAVDFDDWFLGEVETGLAQVDAGQTMTNDAVGERMAKKLAEHDARR